MRRWSALRAVAVAAAALVVAGVMIATGSSATAITATTTQILLSPSGQQSVGSTVLIEVQLSPSTAVGTVSLYDGSTLLGTGDHYTQQWGYTTSTLAAGTHALRATFTPDSSSYAASSATATDVVTTGATAAPPAPSGPVATTTSVVVSPTSPQPVGSTVVISVMITPSTAVGTVALYDGTALLGGGSHYSHEWGFTTSSLLVGTHALHATFTPDSPSSFSSSAGTFTDVVTPAVVPNAPPSPGSPVSSPTSPPPPATNCHLSEELVPSCGVILGGTFSSFGGTDTQSSFNNFNADSGSTASLDHDYRTPGQTLSAADIAVAREPDTLLLVNWKPATTWVDADGANTAVNAQIDAMARSVQTLGTTKIMMTLYHEPENNVTGNAPGCPATTTYLGSAGTPADYRAMWSNVEARFTALGVTNVVWAMNYMGYNRWNCMVNDLWPGNTLINWVLWDPYMHTNLPYTTSVASFYNELTTLSDPTHDYLSKPWGLAEFGDDSPLTTNQDTFYTTVAATLTNNTFPKLKLLTLFDKAGNGWDLRVAYTATGTYDPTELTNLTTLSTNPTITAGRQSITGGIQP